LHGGRLDIRVAGEIVEFVVQDLTTDGELFGHEMLVPATDEIAVIVTGHIRIGPGITAGAVNQAASDLVAAAQLGAEHLLDVQAADTDIGKVVIQAAADDPAIAEVVIVPADDAADNVIAAASGAEIDIAIPDLATGVKAGPVGA